MENIIAGLKSRDRVSKVHIFDVRGPVLKQLVDVLHEPLPVLTDFSLASTDVSAPVLPESFLGGFSPHLQSFALGGIPFPSFPKFILCFPHIRHLHLFEIPSSGYISPEVMATSLAALPNLESLFIGFRSPPSRLLQSSPPHLTRASLPALSSLAFAGVSEYFEDVVARIDTPRLTWLSVTFFMDLIFDIPQLRNVIDHTEGLKPFNQAAIKFSGRTIEIVLGPPARFELEIRCERPDWQLSSMTQIFSQQMPVLSHVEQLEILEYSWGGFLSGETTRTWIPCSGSNYFTCLSLCRVCTYPRDWCPPLQGLSKISRGKWPRTYYLCCGLFSWKDSSHPDLYMKP